MSLPTVINGDPPFIHLEIKMAARLGLNRDEIRALRQHYLTEGTHWKLHKKRIYLSEEGVNLIVSKKGLPLPGPEPKAAPINDPAHPRQLLLMAPFEGDMIAWNSPANTHILLAILPEDNAANPQFVARVRVKSNINFTRGMKLRARHVQNDLYELVGQCPRWKGRY